MTLKHPRSMVVKQGLISFGRNINIARRHRRLSQQDLAQSSGLHIGTIKNLEKGSPGISIANLGMVLVCLGEDDILGKILVPWADDIGIIRECHNLSKRIRQKKEQDKIQGYRKDIQLFIEKTEDGTVVM